LELSPSLDQVEELAEDESNEVNPETVLNVFREILNIEKNNFR
jgi:hypothetical protein